MIDLDDRVCLPNSPGGGRSGISGQQSIPIRRTAHLSSVIPANKCHLQGDSPCTGGLQLTARSEGRCTYLVSSLQISVIRANDTNESMFGHRIFFSTAAGIKPMTSSTKGQCTNHKATTFPIKFRWNAIFQHFSTILIGYSNELFRVKKTKQKKKKKKRIYTLHFSFFI